MTSISADRVGRGWLDGKVALLVGAGRGIGRAVLDSFVDEGARVAVLELATEGCEAVSREQPATLVVQGDATRWDANARAVDEVIDAYGRLDVLATFVGIFDFYTPLAEVPPDRLDDAFAEIFDTNVKSYLLSVRAAMEALREARGSIVLTLSTSSYYPGRGGSLYVATKFATRGLVMQLGHELAPAIRVNGVAPGGTMSTGLRGLRSLDLHDRDLGETAERERTLAERVPLGFALRPEDHAGAYVYLASDRSVGVTGTVVHSDGGIAVR